jgi:hypothetical protein
MAIFKLADCALPVEEGNRGWLDDPARAVFYVLLGENELFVSGYLKAVLFSRMLDNQRARISEKRTAFHDTPGRGITANVLRLSVPDRIQIIIGALHD